LSGVNGDDGMTSKTNTQITDIGRFLRARRKERGITQAELARHAEVSYTLVNRIENGDMNVQAVSLNKVLGVFGYRIGPVPRDRSVEESDV